MYNRRWNRFGGIVYVFPTSPDTLAVGVIEPQRSDQERRPANLYLLTHHFKSRSIGMIATRDSCADTRVCLAWQDGETLADVT
jgi:hypothetical protein